MMDATEQAKRAGNRKGGSSRSQAKTDAARLNGRKGGRPKPTLEVLIHRAWIATCKENPEMRQYLPDAKPKLPKVPKYKAPESQKPLRGAALIEYMHRHGEYRGQKCPCQECEQKRLPPDFNPGR